MSVRMDRFRSGGGPKQLGDLRAAFRLSLSGKGEVLAIGLAFTCEGGLEVV
jgi:hypothetical protein